LFCFVAVFDDLRKMTMRRRRRRKKKKRRRKKMHHVFGVPNFETEDSDYETTIAAHLLPVENENHQDRSKRDDVRHDTNGAALARVVPSSAVHGNVDRRDSLAVAELPPFVDQRPPYQDEYDHGLQHPRCDNIRLVATAPHLPRAPHGTEPTAKYATSR
jgi:hypothetical protein